MGPYFETWKHQTLVRFAKESYEKLQRQEEELQKLRLAQLEVPTTCPSCAKLKTRITTLEQGIRQVGTALKEAMT